MGGARPGTEGTLALAMANVIVRQRLARAPVDASRLTALLARHAPRAVAESIGIEAEVIVRLAIRIREFPGRARGCRRYGLAVPERCRNRRPP